MIGLMMSKKLYYLACPYSHPKKKVMDARFKEVTRVAAELTKRGLVIFSPISMNHYYSDHVKISKSWDFWAEHDKTFLARCDGLIVCMHMPGWDNSVGVRAEMDYAEELGIPIRLLTLDETGRKLNVSFINTIEIPYRG